MASKFNTGYSGFTDSIDAFMGDSKIGAQARVDRNLDRQGRRVEVSDNSATETQVVPALIQKERQALLGYMPVENVDQLDKPTQTKIFDLNYRNKNEASTADLTKESFDKVKAAGEKQLEKFKIQPNEGKVAHMRELNNPGTEVSFDLKNLFEAGEVDKVLSLDPTKEGRFQAGTFKDDLSSNVETLTEAVFGQAFSNHINAIVTDRLGGTGTSPNTALRDTLLEYVGQNVPAGAVNAAEVSRIVAEAIKISLLKDPSKAHDIISILASDSAIDLKNIPGFDAVLQDRVVKYIVDMNAADNQAFFNTADAGAPSLAQVKENRRLLADQLKNGVTTTGVTLTKGGTTAVTSVVNITQLSAVTGPGVVANIFASPNINIDAKSATGPAAATISTSKNDAFRALADQFTNPAVKALVKDLSKALTRNSATAKNIFENVYNQAVVVGGDKTKSKLDRYQAFAKAYRYIFDNKASAANATSLNAMESKLEQFALPERIMANTQAELLGSVVAVLSGLTPVPAELSALNATQLSTDVQQALANGSLDSAMLERLAMIAAGVPDANKRKEILSNLRAVANLEVIKEIAEQAAGSDTGPKYQQYLMALTNRFVFRDSGTATPATAEQLSTQLLGLLFAQDKDAAVTAIGIQTNAPLNGYLQAILPTGTAIEQKLDLVGQVSTGLAYTKAHELFGIVRRGQEAGEIWALSSQTQAQKEAFLVANMGFTAGTPELLAAVIRLDEVLATAAPTDGSMHLNQMIDAAAGNKPTDYGLRYTNMMRMYRHYIENGGTLTEVMRNSETLQANSFIQAIQEQANAKTGVAQGGVMTEGNRVMSIEEQRSAILADYEALGARTGVRGWVDRLKRVAPRIAKAVGLMALTTAAVMFPPAAGAMAIIGAGLRVASIVSTVRTGIPVIKQAWASGNWKAGIAAGLAIGVNVAVSTLVPSPLGYGLTLIGESIGTELYADRQLAKEVKTLHQAYTNYDTALGTMMTSLNPANAADMEYLNRVARSINVPVVNTVGTTNVDLGTTVTNIIAARNAAHTNGNMTILRSFSQVVEEKMATQITTINNEHIKAKKAHTETQQTIMAYAVASSATKLGFGLARGFASGYEKAGIFGGLAGAFGLSMGEAGPQEIDSETSEGLTGLHQELESDFDQRAEELGVSHDGNNVIAMVHTENGDNVALVDMDGDPNTVEMVVDVDNTDLNNPSAAELDFSEASPMNISSNTDAVKAQVAMMTGTQVSAVQVTPAPTVADDSVLNVFTAGSQSFALVGGQNDIYHLYNVTSTADIGGAGVDNGGTLNGIETIAQPGDSQWTIIEDTYREAYPGLADQTYYTATANSINEAGTSGVYQQVYENRGMDVHGGSAISVGDKLTLMDIKEMAPNTFERMTQTTGVTYEAGTPSVSSTGVAETNTTFALGKQIDVLPETLTGNGMVVFGTNGEAHYMVGEMGFGTGSNNTGGTGGAGTTTPVDDSANAQPATASVQDSTVAAEPDKQTPGEFVKGEWNRFAQAVDNQGDQSVGGTGGAGDSTVAASAANTQGTMTNDEFKVHDPGIFDRDFKILEDTVAKIIVSGGPYGEAQTITINPDEVNIIRIVPGEEVIYRDANGETFHARGSDIKIAFKGNEDVLVDADSGQQTLLSRAGDAVQSIGNAASYTTDQVNQAAGQVHQAADNVAEDVNTVDQHITDTSVSVDQAASGIKETVSDIGTMLSNTGETVFDPGFTGTGDALITHTGDVNNPYVTNDTQHPVWLEAIAVSTESGEGNKVIPVENVYRIGQDYVQYRDATTNEIVTVNGNSITGVGYTYDNSTGTPQMNVSEPYIWKFDPESPTRPSIEKVENPWWNQQVIDMLPEN